MSASIARFVTVALLLGACAGTPETETADSLGTLRVAVTGMPDGGAAGILVTGPDGMVRAVDETTSLTDLAAGTYEVEAPDLLAGADLYTATLEGAPAMVTAGGLATVTVDYTFEPPPGPIVHDVVLVDYTGLQVRQGWGDVILEVTGERLDGVTSAGLGSLPATIESPTPTRLLVRTSVPGAAALGPVDLTVADEEGSTTFDEAFLVTPITVSVAGSDRGNRPGTPDEPFRTISHAVGVAVPGDTIELTGGRFYSNVEFWPLTVDSVTVRGAGPDQTIVVGPGSGTGFRLGGDARLSDMRLTQFTHAARLVDGDLVLENLKVVGNTSHGVYPTAPINDVQSVLVRDSSFDDNGGAGFIATTDEAPATYLFERTSFTGNDDQGLYVLHDSQVTLVDCVLEQNRYGLEMVHAGGSVDATRVEVRDNDLNGIELDNGVMTLTDSEVHGSLQHGIVASGFSTFTMRGTDVTNNLVDGIQVHNSASVDLGTVADPGGNTIGLDGGVSSGDFLADERSGNRTPDIQAVGLLLDGTDPSGLQTGVDAQTPYWRIEGANNHIQFGN